MKVNSTNNAYADVKKDGNDTTHNKRAKEDIRGVEDKYKTLFQVAKDAIFLTDETGRIIEVNQAACDSLGYTNEELLELSIKDIDADPRGYEAFQKLQDGQVREITFEVNQCRKDGTLLPVEITGSILSTIGDKRVSLAIARDITGRKKVEKKLQLFSKTVENAPDGIQIIDLNGCIIYSNKAVERIYGFSIEELKGKHVNEMNLDPDFADNEIIPAIIKTGNWVGELLVKHKNGGIFPIWLSTSMVNDNDGKPVAMVGIIKDITKLRQAEKALQVSEARYRSLFEDSPICLWECDMSEVKNHIESIKAKGIKNIDSYFKKHPEMVAKSASLIKILAVNKTSIKTYKAKRKEELLENLDNIFTEESYDLFRQELIDISEGKTSFERETKNLRLDGNELDVNFKWIAAPGYEESLGKVFVSIIDITKRKQAEEEIKRKTHALEESNRVKDLFTDIIHHDLSNPLNIAFNYTDILLAGEIDPKKKSYLNIINRNLAKSQELIESATMLSKLASLESVEFQNLDLKTVIEGVIENFEPLASESGINIENRIIQSIPVRANTIIEEVFANFISNAIKYASNGKKIILDYEDNNDFWKIKVIDFGGGIKDADKAGIFERFQTMGKKGVKGSGLGLAIARKIINLHNGRIYVEDNPDGGAVFIVEIPKL